MAKLYRTENETKLVRYVRAKQPRTDREGNTIPAGESYYQVYDVSMYDQRVKHVYNLQAKDVHHCELCGGFILDPTKRFCSKACAEEHLRRANVEFEEKTFWENEAVM